MDKFAERKKFSNRKFIATASVAMCLLGCMGASEVSAAPIPQVVATSKATATVSGVVKDEAGNPIIGASVVEKGTTRGVSTDLDGKFSFKAAPGATLQISYLGYGSKTVKASSNMEVVLMEDNALLEELVVVGYGQQKKVNLTGAVATVDMDKAIGSRPEADVTKALQGSVPGLTIMSNSGDLNSDASISIRGLGTLSNDQKSAPLIVVDGVPVEDLSVVNGSDIASISVLKDAASSSIYGARAAFGVVLVTTKSGKKGDSVKVNYNANFAWDQATYLPDFPDVPTQLKSSMMAKARAGAGAVELFGMYFDKLLPYAEKWQQQNPGGKRGYGPMRPYVDENNVGDYRFIGGQPMYYADYDLQDIWYNNAAPSMNHNVSLSGSSGRTTYYGSFGFNTKDDLMNFNPSTRKRWNAQFNMQTDVTDWLTFGTRVSFSRRQFSKADSYAYPYQYIWRWGSFFIPSGTIDGYDFRVIAMQKQAARKVINRDVVRMTAFAKANITKDLTVNADFSYEIANMNSRSADVPVYGYNWLGTTPTYIVTESNSNTWRDNSKSNTWTVNAYANYNHTWNEAHNLNVMLGVNAEKYTYDYFYAERPKLYDPTMPDLDLTYGDPAKWAINSAANDRASAGYFGRINYDYKGKYLFELNGRYDGSSRFPTNDHWAFFPSGSLGYRISEESFFEPIKHVVDNAKIRASYGEIGNEAIGDWMFVEKIAPVAQSKVYWLDSKGNKVNQFDMPQWVSTSLTWERISTLDIGLDLGLFNDQIVLGFDWFQRDTKDMLAPGKALPSSVGAETPLTNAGQLRSRGWELSLQLRRQFTKDLSLYANFNIGDAKVKVVKWNNDSRQVGHPCDPTHAYAGQNWGDIWGFETDRYFTVDDFTYDKDGNITGYAPGVASQVGIQTDNFVYGPGDIKFKDLDGDGVITGGVPGKKDANGNEIAVGSVGNTGDLKVIGNQLPRYEYSFHIGGAWKGLDFDFFFQGVGKRDMWTQSSFVFPMMRDADVAIYANQVKYNVYDPANGIINISEDNDFPCLYPGNEAAGNVKGLAGQGGEHNYYPQTKYLVDMSYLRLKNITLGYTLPTEWTKKAYIEKLRLYASVDNLCLLHKGSGDLPVDPEMNAGQGGYGNGVWGRTYPVTRSWSFGLQLTF